MRQLPFAEELAAAMGCASEYERLPSQEFFEEAAKPPPIYFETDTRTLEGVCCVCYKKGVMGKCSNPECGLLMHYTCVPPRAPGESQKCPVCQNEPSKDEDKPLWHEAEVGAKNVRPKPKLAPETRNPPFPHDRWPALSEAKVLGFPTLLDWYVDTRGAEGVPKNLSVLQAEFTLAENTRKPKPGEEEENFASISAELELCYSFDQAETVNSGSVLKKPYAFYLRLIFSEI